MSEGENKSANLGEKIKKAKSQYSPSQQIQPKSFGKVMKVVVEIVAAMAVGLGIGILIDNYFETRPIFIIVFFLLGSAAGILNVFRVAKSLQKN
ncbi:MAG: ATPase F0F1 [Rhodobiaceae bacterium]|nr:ATPase F0F1 [Rhodobiaceae bacterium]|tara:strand:- start:9957 stop:10238 length:282 start_codon:yes stop_codon:yes gene_type:complete